MPKEERARIFDAFYTTKPGGLGLGLTVAHNLVKNHGGRIEITDNPGGGSIFSVVLPAVLQSPGAFIEREVETR